MQRVAVYGILLRDARETAVLHGYRLEFASHEWARAVFATLVPAPGEQTVVGIVETTAEGVYGYDRIEGADPGDPTGEGGLYRRMYVQPELNDSTEQVGAWVYLMNDPTIARPDGLLVQRMILEYVRLGIPTRQVLEAVLRGYRAVAMG